MSSTIGTKNILNIFKLIIISIIIIIMHYQYYQIDITLTAGNQQNWFTSISAALDA